MKRIFAAIVFCAACSWSAAAQSADPIGISAGARVRVSVDQGPLMIGSVVRLTPQTLELADSRSGVRQMNTSSVTSLEVSRGRPVYGHRLAMGALKGFAILGGAATLAILASDPGWAFVGPLVFGPPGALIGAVRANATKMNPKPTPATAARISVTTRLRPLSHGQPARAAKEPSPDHHRLAKLGSHHVGRSPAVET